MAPGERRGTGDRALRIIATALLCVLLLATLVSAASCGRKSVTRTRDGRQELEPTDIDAQIERMDASMESVSPDDFGESNLSESELGL